MFDKDIWKDMRMVTLTERIKKLEQKVQELERYQEFRGQFWSLNEGKAVFHCGNASLTMKKDGSLELKGRDIEIDASGKIVIKSTSTVQIKGQQILEN